MMYDGTRDPDDHIAQYKQKMLAVALPKESREATMCKEFGSTLIGPALQWYINFPTRSISSFAGLSDKFVEQFASRRSLEKTSDGLYEILQHRVEPLRDYIARFNQEKVAVLECNIPTEISAFKRGLLPDGGLLGSKTVTTELPPENPRRSSILEDSNQTNQARPLRNYHAYTLSGRCVATKSEPKLGRYEATELESKLGRYCKLRFPQGLYKELTMYPCKTMEDVLSRAWAQVKWEEDVASRAKAQPKQDQRSTRSDRGN
ncbi:hypothetical protein F2Q68_00034483 [Brassica cretica]|uniref:Retrotransposon gag domain-containing protein n=1 Tax=Brassica cretica TaxID=69181 RepID=A0A8S9H1T6_BRACR|nr:hypothetical protein F2Q68_00034483 [Brassica cretica]